MIACLVEMRKGLGIRGCIEAWKEFSKANNIPYTKRFIYAFKFMILRLKKILPKSTKKES
jgi:hypothetical protein